MLIQPLPGRILGTAVRLNLPCETAAPGFWEGSNPPPVLVTSRVLHCHIGCLLRTASPFLFPGANLLGRVDLLFARHPAAWVASADGRCTRARILISVLLFTNGFPTLRSTLFVPKG